MTNAAPGCKMEYFLRQENENALIHFQAEPPKKKSYQLSGDRVPTIRGTEFKPMLDEYICRQHPGNDPEWPPKEWCLGQAKKVSDEFTLYHFRYKVDIRPGEGEKATVKNGKNARGAIIYSTPLRLTITCFIPGLREEIDRQIEGFVADSAFGASKKDMGRFVLERPRGIPQKGGTSQ